MARISLSAPASRGADLVLTPARTGDTEWIRPCPCLRDAHPSLGTSPGSPLQLPANSCSPLKAPLSSSRPPSLLRRTSLPVPRASPARTTWSVVAWMPTGPGEGRVSLRPPPLRPVRRRGAGSGRLLVSLPTPRLRCLTLGGHLPPPARPTPSFALPSWERREASTVSFSSKPFYASLWLMEVPVRDKNGCGKGFEKFTAGGEGGVFIFVARGEGPADRGCGGEGQRPSTLWHLMSISALPEKQGHQIFTKAALNINLQDADV